VSNLVLKIEKKIKADPTRLFRAWLTAEDFPKWFLSGEAIGLGSVHIDPRPGGRFQIDMTLDGKTLPHEGEYLVVEEPKKLVFTWKSHATNNQETLVTITFDALPAITVEGPTGRIEKPETLVTLTHEQLTSDIEINMHRHGWTSILSGLENWQG
jgi:uncharacterized protein YndB with AHSA1/START domain